jgi:hypothetical protein
MFNPSADIDGSIVDRIFVVIFVASSERFEGAKRSECGREPLESLEYAP